MTPEGLNYLSTFNTKVEEEVKEVLKAWPDVLW